MKRKPPVLDKPYPRNRPVLEEEAELWRATVEGKKKEPVKLPSLETKQSLVASTAAIKKSLNYRELERLDAVSLKKIRREKLSIEATLDLHGHTQETAYNTLKRFILRAQTSGLRTVLIITGKGRGNEGKTLRERLPRWLSESPLREAIIGYDSAGTRHGGAGAWYIRIRKL